MEEENFTGKNTLISDQAVALNENNDLNNINDINQDVLQQALQQSLLTEIEQDFQQDTFLGNQYSDDINKNIFTLFESEASHQDPNVEITVEQAEALGFTLDPITKEVITIGKNLELNNIHSLEIQPINLEANQYTLQEEIGNKSEIECLISNEQNSFDLAPFINEQIPVQQEVTSQILEDALNGVDLRNASPTETNINCNLNNLECIKINTTSANLNNLLKEIKLNNITNIDSSQLCKQIKINNIKTPKQNLDCKIKWTENEVNKKISNVILNSNFLSLINIGKPSKESTNSTIQSGSNIEEFIESTEIGNLTNDENINSSSESTSLQENNMILPSRNLTLDDSINKNKQSNEIILNLNKPHSKLSVPHFNNTKPLGSSENPIQLVQQGPTFHSMQILSQEQLRQITSVLQNHNLDASQKGKNIYYDAETNTRIIYRIVYPEELNLHDPNKQLEKSNSLIEDKPAKTRGRGRPPNSLKKQSLDMTNQQESNKKDNEDNMKNKKKKVARTRSGRLSRPPRHMIKDYKRIHSVDLTKPDVEDSDEYYSDYKNSEQDDNGENKELFTGLTIPTKRRQISSQFRCPTCSKIYLGYTRMANHFTAFPDHGNIDHLKSTLEQKEEKIKKILENSNRRGKKRGSWNSELRRIRIKELIQSCSKEELGELIGPTISNIFSLCELALLRLESLRNQNENLMKFILKEISQLIYTLRKVASDILFPYSEDSTFLESSFIKLIDKDLCTILGLNEGNYKLDETKLQINDIITEEASLVFCKRMRKDNGHANGLSANINELKELNSKCEINLNINTHSEKKKSFNSEINEKLAPHDNSLIIQEELSANETQNELETVDDILKERLDTLNCFSDSKSLTNDTNLHHNLREFRSEDNFETELSLVNNNDSEQRMDDFSNLVQLQQNSLNNTFSDEAVNNFDPDIALNEIVNADSSKHNLDENFLPNSLSNPHNSHYDRVLNLETLETKGLNYSNPQNGVPSTFESDIEMIDSSNLNTNNADSDNCRRQFQIPGLTALDGSELDFEAFTQFEPHNSPR